MRAKYYEKEEMASTTGFHLKKQSRDSSPSLFRQVASISIIFLPVSAGTNVTQPHHAC